MLLLSDFTYWYRYQLVILVCCFSILFYCVLSPFVKKRKEKKNITIYLDGVICPKRHARLEDNKNAAFLWCYRQSCEVVRGESCQNSLVHHKPLDKVGHRRTRHIKHNQLLQLKTNLDHYWDSHACAYNCNCVHMFIVPLWKYAQLYDDQKLWGYSSLVQ